MDRARKTLSRRFSLQEDKAADDVIDASLRAGSELKGATAWVLIFAIFIASIGLNVNSTAVIIGAMLVSPLMGPIMGVGYGVGIYDFKLIRKSLLSLAVAATISLLTSTLYFFVTPLTEAHSELLARTSPTIWDVLIALFGGLAGIIGVTRSEKSNVIPGVAIATALMPPLCTAGYGLANGRWAFFGGAIYLFAINCVFIAVATVIVIGYLGLTRRKAIDQHIEDRIKRWLIGVVAFTALPSVYLAYQLVGNAVFESNARKFIAQSFRFEQTHVVETVINGAGKRIEVTLIGMPLGKEVLHDIESRLDEAGLQGAVMVVHQSANQQIDVTSLKAGIVSELYRDSQKSIAERDQQIQKLKADLLSRSAWLPAAVDIERELKAQYPELHDVLIGQGSMSESAGQQAQKVVPFLSMVSPRPFSQSEQARVKAWFMARTKSTDVRLFVHVDVPPSSKKARRH
ncbi:DUF389 domain-containing protein [Aquabacterium sp. NJ1]|uniref:DUF389 domain-containing protein n=1 Tax=Aquabacterium sp. NJ1 TaxID=1538295 RepID=UPI000691530A|nr:DUF389 domain-containing protein [Aquabacterium sp. NJ1]